jgi:NAD(P)-dependent dehydrogenase (short-subunit alcohol dehydrogenase family)
MFTELFDLKSKIAIVTGAASGIGQATTRQLASFGAHVIATDLDERSLPETASAAQGSIETLRHDVTFQADWDAVFARARSAGRLDTSSTTPGSCSTGHPATFRSRCFVGNMQSTSRARSSECKAPSS